MKNNRYWLSLIAITLGLSFAPQASAQSMGSDLDVNKWSSTLNAWSGYLTMLENAFTHDYFKKQGIDVAHYQYFNLETKLLAYKVDLMQRVVKNAQANISTGTNSDPKYWSEAKMNAKYNDMRSGYNTMIKNLTVAKEPLSAADMQRVTDGVWINQATSALAYYNWVKKLNLSQFRFSPEDKKMIEDELRIFLEGSTVSTFFYQLEQILNDYFVAGGGNSRILISNGSFGSSSNSVLLDASRIINLIYAKKM